MRLCVAVRGWVQVENKVVGAPCGIMDQMASALGQRGKLLALLCQPSEVLGCLPIPASLALWGVDSGVRHALSAEGQGGGGSDYASVRTAAFMGRRIVQVCLWLSSDTLVLNPLLAAGATAC